MPTWWAPRPKVAGSLAMTSPYVLPAFTALPAMNDQQRATFYAYYPSVERDELTGVLLAVVLGSLGAHHFYLRRPVLGVLYFLFSWTSIPFFLGLIEAFFMPARVRRFNAEQGALLAMSIVNGVPLGRPAMRGPCPHCGRAQVAGVRYCAGCGSAVFA
jgi:TM2 domain-containing membrane protein YozV